MAKASRASRVTSRIIKSLASLKLAVVVILSIATITAWGTFVEAQFDATTAQKIVYKSVWMYTILGIFALNLIAVMIDRWPWQKRHTGFVLAHIGILTLLVGAYVTQHFGLDGSINMAIGDHARQVTVSQTDLVVYTSFDGSSFRKLFEREVDFFLKSPTPENPLDIPMPAGKLEVVRSLRYALRDEKTVATDDVKAGAAIRFQLSNARVNLSDWLVQPTKDRGVKKDLGPAQVVIGGDDIDASIFKDRNAIVLRPQKNSDELQYEIFTASRAGQIKRGHAKAGDAIDTGWMGLTFRLLKYIPQAKQEVTYKEVEKPTPLTTTAIEVNYNGAHHWMGLNSLLKLFSDDAVYIITYGNRRLDIGFEMKLKEFTVGHYQGTTRAATYQSVVSIVGDGEHTISMNEPLKREGYTFYQASFDQDDQGRPVASILSVNRDPGRWIKYLGALMIVFGAIHLFYFKRKTAKAGGGSQ